MADEDYAVVVGLSRYPGLGNLNGPENDARNFAQWLKDKNGGAVPANQVKLILSSRYRATDDLSNARPQEDAVVRAFETIINRIVEGGGRSGRRLYIFLAGHGFGPSLEESALFMANADSNLFLGHHIPGRRYALWFATAYFFKEVVLFMDCCRDKFLNAPLSLPPWKEVSNPPGGKCFYGFAAQFAQKSLERRIAEGEDVHGLFTHALLEGLNGKARDARGYITGASLADYTYNRLRDLSENDEEQEPVFDGPNQQKIIFAEGVAPVLTRAVITFDAPQDVPFELVDARFKSVKTGVGGAAPVEVSGLDKGIYKVRVPGTAREQYFEVKGEDKVDVKL